MQRIRQLKPLWPSPQQCNPALTQKHKGSEAIDLRAFMLFAADSMSACLVMSVPSRRLLAGMLTGLALQPRHRCWWLSRRKPAAVESLTEDTMKVIIAGSRGFRPEQCRELLRMDIKNAVSNGIGITEVVCGKSRGGMDKYAREWAAENSVPVSSFGANYDALRAFAGYSRNDDLVKHGEALIAVTNGTAGTEHLIHVARQSGMPVFVIAVSYVNEVPSKS